MERDMNRDNLGDLMKMYEKWEAGRYLMARLPILIRLDGKAFHSFTRGLARPYDSRLSDLMVDTTKFLVEQSNALIGYTQSDEISLCIYTDGPNSEVFLGGKIHKLCSVLASMAAAYFNQHLPAAIPEKAGKLAYFDNRVWNVPNLEEAANVFVWRELDATKNAISMVAQAYFSHSALQNKHAGEMQEMLWSEHGINFNDYPSSFKRGTYVRRVTKDIAFTAEELEKLPPKHTARDNPGLMVRRSVVEQVELPKITSIANKVEVLFMGAEPVTVENNTWETRHGDINSAD
jgi:tRNA(His) 5'-end guanylyltransferase